MNTVVSYAGMGFRRDGVKNLSKSSQNPLSDAENCQNCQTPVKTLNDEINVEGIWNNFQVFGPMTPALTLSRLNKHSASTQEREKTFLL